MRYNGRTYLDYNATCPARPEAMDAWLAAMHMPLNPSSVHTSGRKARELLEEARESLSKYLCCKPKEIIFTASGSEANNTAIKSAITRGMNVIASSSEHPSLIKAASSARLIELTSKGNIDISHLEAILESFPRTSAMVSVMLANNETGVINPIREVSAVCRRYGALLHTDASQFFGKLSLDFSATGADLMTVSAHKMGGVNGAAALIVREGVEIMPLISGNGSQEAGRRAGTPNVAAIRAFAAAAKASAGSEGHMRLLARWLRSMENELAKNSAVVFGQESERLPNTSCIAILGVTGETQLMHFDMEGIEVSAGAACSSGRTTPPHTLLAMGVGESLASCAIRISGGWNTKEEDIIKFKESWLRLRQRVTARKAA